MIVIAATITDASHAMVMQKTIHDDVRVDLSVYLTDAGREAVARYLDRFAHMLSDASKKQRLGAS